MGKFTVPADAKGLHIAAPVGGYPAAGGQRRSSSSVGNGKAGGAILKYPSEFRRYVARHTLCHHILAVLAYALFSKEDDFRETRRKHRCKRFS